MIPRDSLIYSNLRQRRVSGSVLLEVILALALFVGAATIISSGINASMRSVDRLRLQTHAVNLAISLLSEMQMKARPVSAGGPEPFPAPFQEWTYQVEIGQGESASDPAASVKPVEVIVRHTQENIVHRLTEMFPASELSESDAPPVEP